MKTVDVDVTTVEKFALDWLVAVCEKQPVIIYPDKRLWTSPGSGGVLWRPSSDPSQGWRIQNREGISVFKQKQMIITDEVAYDPNLWMAYLDGNFAVKGPNSLVAAMRCRVFSKLGRYLQVPKELV